MKEEAADIHHVEEAEPARLEVVDVAVVPFHPRFQYRLEPRKGFAAAVTVGQPPVAVMICVLETPNLAARMS